MVCFASVKTTKSNMIVKTTFEGVFLNHILNINSLSNIFNLCYIKLGNITLWSTLGSIFTKSSICFYTKKVECTFGHIDVLYSKKSFTKSIIDIVIICNYGLYQQFFFLLCFLDYVKYVRSNVLLTSVLKIADLVCSPFSNISLHL